MGTGGYNVVFNNCEHFATWCRTGIAASRQSQAGWIGQAAVGVPVGGAAAVGLGSLCSVLMAQATVTVAVAEVEAGFLTVAAYSTGAIVGATAGAAVGGVIAVGYWEGTNT